MANKTVTFDLFKLGATVFSDGDSIEISSEFAQNIIANFKRLKAEGQVVPVLVEHNRNGRKVGEVVDVFLADGWIQGRLLLTTAEYRQAWNDGEIDFDSPGFVLNHEHPHTGEQLSETLFEVSLTSLPRQINLRPATQLNPGVVLAFGYEGQLLTGDNMSIELSDQTLLTDMQDEAEEEEEEQESEFSLSDTDVDRIATRLAALMSGGNELSEDTGGENVDLSEDEVAHLSQRVDQLEAENTRLELSAAGITDADDIQLLSSVKRSNPTAYKPLMEKLSKLSKTKAKPQSPIGYGGSTQAGGGSLVSRVDQALSASGITDGKEKIKFIDKTFGREARSHYMKSK